LVEEHTNIQNKIQDALDVGIHIALCKVCVDYLKVSKTLEKLGIEAKYLEAAFVEIFKN